MPATPCVVDVVIPALDEEGSVGRVVARIPRTAVRRIVVVDNGSSDRTAQAAREAGAEVVAEPRRGYGSACLAGLDRLRREPPWPDAVVFLDADASDRPEELPALVEPIATGRADLVVGSRVLGRREPGALPPHARLGNSLATALIRRLYGARFTDLGPFRAIRWAALEEIAMRDRDYGWTVEMQVKAAKAGLRTVEVPVSYGRRVGRSKVSGTIAGTIGAGWKILWTVFRHAAPSRRR